MRRRRRRKEEDEKEEKFFFDLEGLHLCICCFLWDWFGLSIVGKLYQKLLEHKGFDSPEANQQS